MLANVREVETYLRERLKEVEQVVEIHGRGFLLGLEFAGGRSRFMRFVAAESDYGRVECCERVEIVAASLFAAARSGHVHRSVNGGRVSEPCHMERPTLREMLVWG
jgi:acetylornithine/succinyldiaminopimelate/putrescine aminotransferase